MILVTISCFSRSLPSVDIGNDVYTWKGNSSEDMEAHNSATVLVMLHP